MKFLCQILGSQCFECATDPSQCFVVLVPDMVDDEIFHEEWLPKLINRKLVPEYSKFNANCKDLKYRISQVKFVYFSWLVDTISANLLAPIRPYCLGFLE